MIGSGKTKCVVFNNDVKVRKAYTAVNTKLQIVMQDYITHNASSPYPCVLELQMDLLMSLPQLPVLLTEVINIF